MNAISPKRRRRVIVQHSDEQVTVASIRIGRDVERAEWRDPDDMAVNRRVPAMVSGYRRRDPLVLMHARKMIDDYHVSAAEKLRDSYEIGLCGANPGAQRSEIRTSGFSGGPSEQQLAALESYRMALQAVGPRLADVLIYVVLDFHTSAEWAEKKGISANNASGYLEAALDALVAHYDTRITSDDIAHAQEKFA